MMFFFVRIGLVFAAIGGLVWLSHPENAFELKFYQWHIEGSVTALLLALLGIVLVYHWLLSWIFRTRRLFSSLFRALHDNRAGAQKKMMEQAFFHLKNEDSTMAGKFFSQALRTEPRDKIAALFVSELVQEERDRQRARSVLAASVWLTPLAFVHRLHQASPGEARHQLALEALQTVQPGAASNCLALDVLLVPNLLESGHEAQARAVLGRLEKLPPPRREPLNPLLGRSYDVLSRAASREKQVLMDAESAAAYHPEAYLQRHAELLIEAKQFRQVQKQIRQNWRACQSWKLAALYCRARGAVTPLEKMRALDELLQKPKTDLEYHLLVETALRASLWGPARRFLHAWLAVPREPAYAFVPLLLMRELEKAEAHAPHRAEVWSDKLLTALTQETKRATLALYPAAGDSPP